MGERSQPPLTAAEAIVAEAVNALTAWTDYSAPGQARVRAWLAEIDAALPECRAAAGRELKLLRAAARELSEAGHDLSSPAWAYARWRAQEVAALVADWRLGLAREALEKRRAAA